MRRLGPVLPALPLALVLGASPLLPTSAAGAAPDDVVCSGAEQSLNRARTSVGDVNVGGESRLANVVADKIFTLVAPSIEGNPEVAEDFLSFVDSASLTADIVPDPGGNVTEGQVTATVADEPLVHLELTGAKVKEALEQQWRAGDPTTPVVNLGLGARYVYTYDPAAPDGQQVTGLGSLADQEFIGGPLPVPLDDETVYTVITTASLAAGGNGFGAFTADLTPTPTLFTVHDALLDTWDGAYCSILAGARQRSVGVSFPAGAPAVYGPGDVVDVRLSSLSFTTPDDPRASAYVASAQISGDDFSTGGFSVLGSGFPVDHTVVTAPTDETGTATVRFRMPSYYSPDTSARDLVLEPQGQLNVGTMASTPLTLEPARYQPRIRVVRKSPRVIRADRTRPLLRIRVLDDFGNPFALSNGDVRVRAAGRVYRARHRFARHQDDVFARLRAFKQPGRKIVRITVSSTQIEKRTIRVKLRVRR